MENTDNIYNDTDSMHDAEQTDNADSMYDAEQTDNTDSMHDAEQTDNADSMHDAVQPDNTEVCEAPAFLHEFSNKQLYIQMGVPYEDLQSGSYMEFDEQAKTQEKGNSAAARFFYAVFAILFALASFAGVTFLMQR